MVEFGIVVVVATLFSLFVSFTLTPMLAARWSVLRRSSEPPTLPRLVPARLRPAHGLVPRPRSAVGAQARHGRRRRLLRAGRSARSRSCRSGSCPSEFVPNSQTGDISMTLTYPVGTPLYKTQAAVDRIEQHILADPRRRVDVHDRRQKTGGLGLDPRRQRGAPARVDGQEAPRRNRQRRRRRSESSAISHRAPSSRSPATRGGGDPIYYVLSGSGERDPGRGRQTRRVH